MGAFQATGSPPARAEQALNSYVQTACISVSSDEFQDVWDPSQDHMGIDVGYYDVAISGMPGKSIIILEVLATTTASLTAGTAFSFTLAEDGATEDLLRMSISASTGRFEGPLKMGVGKSLEFYKGKAQAGAVQTLTISYIFG